MKIEIYFGTNLLFEIHRHLLNIENYNRKNTDCSQEVISHKTKLRMKQNKTPHKKPKQKKKKRVFLW